MIAVEAIRCPACGGPQRNQDQKNCVYCGTALVISSNTRIVFNNRSSVSAQDYRRLKETLRRMECMLSDRSLVATFAPSPLSVFQSSIQCDGGSIAGRVDLFISWALSKRFSDGTPLFAAWLTVQAENCEIEADRREISSLLGIFEQG